MGKDYYSILGLTKNATREEIKRAYKKLALKYHPDKNKSIGAEETFKKVAEAYEILGDPEKKRIYDRHGESGFKGNNTNNGRSFSYTFHDPKQMFEEFFGGKDPFADMFGDLHNMDNDFGPHNIFDNFPFYPHHERKPQYTRSKTSATIRKDPPIEHDLRLSLEDVLNGCTKRIKISRRRLNPDGITDRNEDKILHIDVKKGWKEGTRITFSNEGDERMNRLPADVVFTVKDIPHPVYKREGSNLTYTQTVTLKNALLGGIFYIPVLGSSRKIPLPISEIINPNTQKRIRGEGLPLPKQPHSRGDLFVKFNIEFPDYLYGRQKTLIREVLP